MAAKGQPASGNGVCDIKRSHQRLTPEYRREAVHVLESAVLRCACAKFVNSYDFGAGLLSNFGECPVHRARLLYPTLQ